MASQISRAFSPPISKTCLCPWYDVWHLIGIEQEKTRKELAIFLLKLKEVCNVSERTIQEVITGYWRLLAHSKSVAKASVKDVLGRAGISLSDVEGLEDTFTNTFDDDVFQHLDTTYKQEMYFKAHFNVVVSHTLSCQTDHLAFQRLPGMPA